MTPCQIILLLAAVSQADTYNYLVYSPIFAHSHANYLGKLADTLTDAGHNVTLLAPLMNYHIRGKFKVHSTKDIITHETDETLIKLQDEMDTIGIDKFWTEYADVFTQMKMFDTFFGMFEHHCLLVSQNEEMKSELKKRKFDVILFEPLNSCGFLMREYLSIKSYIIATSLPVDEFVSYYSGEPFPLSSVPLMMSSLSNKMSFFQRLQNFLEYSGLMTSLMDGVPEKVTKNFGLTSLRTRIGGIVVDVKKLRSGKVDAEFDKVLSRRDKTVLMSFGTVARASVMPDHYKQNLLKVFASMPDVTFIWKYENDGLDWASGATNVYFSKWVPQAALLADTRLTAFITHGGLGSTTELAYFGKPALMVPLFADQMRNAKMLERHGGAKVISKTQLGDFDAVKDALRNILYEESYRINAETIAKQLEHQPISPRETVVKHAEFAAMFKDMSALDFAGTELNFFQYYLIDILAFVLLIFVLSVYFVYRVVRVVLNFRTTKLKKQ